MSHILDALKKSELERSRGAAPEFSAAQMMITQKRRKTPVWVYFLAVLLVANILFISSSYWQTQPAKDSSLPVLSLPVDNETSNPIDSYAARIPQASKPDDYQQNNPKVDGLSAVDAGLTDSQMKLAPEYSPSITDNTSMPGDTYGQSQDDFIRIDPRPKSVTNATNVTPEKAPSGSASGMAVPAAPPPLVGQRPASAVAETAIDPDSVSAQPQRQTVATAPAETRAPAAKVRDEATDIPYLYDMDKSFQQTIPSLVFNSHIYSSDPNRRRIMINDQYLKIGQTVSGLTVEDVTQEGVVLRKDNVSFRLSVIRNWAFGK